MDLLRFVTFTWVVICAVLYFLYFELVIQLRSTFVPGSVIRFGSRICQIGRVNLFDNSLAQRMLWYIPKLHRFAQANIRFTDCFNISGIDNVK